MSRTPRLLICTVPYLGLVSSGVLVLMVAGCGGESVSPTGPEDVGAEPVGALMLTFAMVSLGEWHTCGLTTSGEAYCWGRNIFGQLGTGDTDDRAIPAAVSNGISFAQVTTRLWHTCGLTASGDAYCWGFNRDGQLGNGSTTGDDPNPTPFAVSGSFTFVSLSAGGHHVCSLTPSGEAYCWGENQYGQLGIGSGRPSATPVAVSGGLTFTSISAGGRHTCGLTPGGEAYCWGRNDYGQLGIGSGAPSATPVAVSGGLTFVSVIAGFRHTCGLTTSGEAYCWGSNNRGALGNGTTVNSATPVAVRPGRSPQGLLITFASLSASGHTCGLTPSGEAYCWGDNWAGQLGNGSTTGQDPNPTPIAVSGGLTFASLSVGVSHTCGLTTSNDAYCWGSNNYGRLGAGTGSRRTTPVLVLGQQ